MIEERSLLCVCRQSSLHSSLVVGPCGNCLLQRGDRWVVPVLCPLAPDFSLHGGRGTTQPALAATRTPGRFPVHKYQWPEGMWPGHCGLIFSCWSSGTGFVSRGDCFILCPFSLQRLPPAFILSGSGCLSLWLDGVKIPPSCRSLSSSP